LAEEKLENDLRKLGFTVIEAAELQLDQCISIFARARWVVAPHGAALANLIFASPGTRVLELLPGSLDKYGHYAMMSAALDIQHNIWHRHGKSSDRFEIDQARMLAWLSAQISEY
jgi:capsular polysaccharide biosynthesis protein